MWSHDTVPGTTMAWAGDINTGANATLTLTGLPANNSSFGEHTVTATVRGQSITRHIQEPGLATTTAEATTTRLGLLETGGAWTTHADTEKGRVRQWIEP